MLSLAYNDCILVSISFWECEGIAESLTVIHFLFQITSSVCLTLVIFSWSVSLLPCTPSFCIWGLWAWVCLRVACLLLIDIKEAHRKGSDACMTAPHPFHAVTFSFVLSCLIPYFLNCLFFPLFFTTPFLSPHSHRTQGMTENPRELQTVWTLFWSELTQCHKETLAMFNYSSQSFFKTIVKFQMLNFFLTSYQIRVLFSTVQLWMGDICFVRSCKHFFLFLVCLSI